MSTTKRTMATIVAMLAMVFALAGCSGGFGGLLQDGSKNFIGDWKLVGMEEDGDVMSEDDIASLEDYGLSVGLTVNEDGTFTLAYFGTELNGEWSAKSATEAEFDVDGEKAIATLADEKISIEQNDSKLVFGKGKANISPTASYGSSYESNSADDADDTVALGTVVADDEIATIVVVDKKTDVFGDPGYTIKVTNNSDAAISVSTSIGQWSVNGKMVDPIYYEQIQPGKYAETIMYFDDLSSLDELSNVEGTFDVVNDKYETIATYTFHE